MTDVSLRQICAVRSMGSADLAGLRALQELATLSLRGCSGLATDGLASLAALTALKCCPTPS